MFLTKRLAFSLPISSSSLTLCSRPQPTLFSYSYSPLSSFSSGICIARPILLSRPPNVPFSFPLSNVSLRGIESQSSDQSQKSQPTDSSPKKYVLTEEEETKKQRLRREKFEAKKQRSIAAKARRLKIKAQFQPAGPFKNAIRKEYNYYCSIGALHTASNVLIRAQKAGVNLSIHTWIDLFSRYAKQGKPESIRQLLPFFDFYYQRTEVIWNLLLDAIFKKPLVLDKQYDYEYTSDLPEDDPEHPQNKKKRETRDEKGIFEARDLLKEMREKGTEPGAITYNIVLTALAKNIDHTIEEFESLFESVRQKERERKQSQKEKSETDEEHLKYIWSTTWNIYLVALGERGMIEKMNQVLGRMEKDADGEGIQINPITIATVVGYYVSHFDSVDVALKFIKRLQETKKIYCCASGWRHIVKWYIQKGKLSECRELFATTILPSLTAAPITPSTKPKFQLKPEVPGEENPKNKSQKRETAFGKREWLLDMLLFALLRSNQLTEAEDILSKEFSQYRLNRRLLNYEMFLETYLRLEKFPEAYQLIQLMQTRNVPIRAHFLRELYLNWPDRPASFNPKFDPLY